MNDDLAKIDPLGRILFSGLWTIADREGRLEDKPEKIKACILPYDKCDVNKLLKSLADGEFIIRYQVNGKGYIAISNWKKHQNPHIKEPASEIPAPCENHTSTVQEPDENGSSPADSLNLIPDSLNLIPDSSSRPLTDKNAKVKYAEHVRMTEKEYDTLVASYGEEDAKTLIEILENYKLSSGKVYKSDYGAILSWCVKRLQDDRKQSKSPPRSNSPDSDLRKKYSVLNI